MRTDKEKRSALQNLYSLLADALNQGADSIELEYVSEGLEVSYMVGNTGIGRIISDRMLAEQIVGSLIEQAKLEKKSRGVLDWVYRGVSYKIKVEEHESFGETAFSLRFRKPRSRA